MDEDLKSAFPLDRVVLRGHANALQKVETVKNIDIVVDEANRRVNTPKADPNIVKPALNRGTMIAARLLMAVADEDELERINMMDLAAALNVFLSHLAGSCSKQIYVHLMYMMVAQFLQTKDTVLLGLKVREMKGVFKRLFGK